MSGSETSHLVSIEKENAQGSTLPGSGKWLAWLVWSLEIKRKEKIRNNWRGGVDPEVGMMSEDLHIICQYILKETLISTVDWLSWAEMLCKPVSLTILNAGAVLVWTQPH